MTLLSELRATLSESQKTHDTVPLAVAMVDAAPAILAVLEAVQKMIEDHGETGGHLCAFEPEIKEALATLESGAP